MPDPDGSGNEDGLLTQSWPFWKRKDSMDQARGFEETPWHMLVNPLPEIVGSRVRGAPGKASLMRQSRER